MLEEEPKKDVVLSRQKQPLDCDRTQAFFHLKHKGTSLCVGWPFVVVLVVWLLTSAHFDWRQIWAAGGVTTFVAEI